MLVLHVANALENTSTNGVAQIFSGRLRMDITQIHGTVEARLGHVRGERHVRRERRRLHWRELSIRLCNERLSGCCLSGLSSSLLRLGDVRATVLPIVDALASPGRLSGESRDDLCETFRRCDQIQIFQCLTFVAVEMLRK